MNRSSDDAKRILGEFISAKRKEKKLYLKDIANYCDVSINYISLVERGIKKPSEKIITKLSEKLEVDEYILFSILSIIPPSIKKNVNTVINEHEGFKELLGELSQRVKDEKLREELYEEMYNVYLNFLKRNNLDDHQGE